VLQQHFGELKDTRSIDPLMRALKDEDSYVRDNAAEAIGKIGKSAVEPLTQALKDNNSYVREVAAEDLGKINDIRAVEPLIQALKDDNEKVRSAAKDALTKLGWQQERNSQQTTKNPIPIGTAIDLGNGWQMKVVNVIPNANEVIQKENTYNTHRIKDTSLL
jgi:HEAT repeat protein